MHAVALGQQSRHLHFAVEHALAPHLGGMRGEHRAHQDGIEEGLQLRARHARRAQRARARPRSCPGPAPQRLGLRAHATDAVLVLGDIGQVRKVAEGAHHLDRALVREAVEGGLELAPRRGVALPAEAIEIWRMRSTVANTASPCCWRMVSPSTRPTSRMSSRSARSRSASCPLFMVRPVQSLPHAVEPCRLACKKCA